MEPRFTVHTVYTKEEYMKFNKAVLMRSKVNIALFVLFIVLIVVMNALDIGKGETMPLLPMIVAVIEIGVYTLIMAVLNRFLAEHAFKSNKLLSGESEEIFFYDDRLEAQTENGNAAIPYDKIHKIYETKTNFYIMIASSQGMIIVKSEAPAGADGFIRDIKSRYSL